MRYSIRTLCRSFVATLATLVLIGGCARNARPPASSEVHQLEEMRITARHTEGGEIELDAYDAETLFNAANVHLREGRCDRAVPLYVRVADEFPSSRFLSPALYNAGLCLKESGDHAEAAPHFERLLREAPTSADAVHARFQLAESYLELERWTDALTQAESLLQRSELTPDERVEAMSRAAQAFLGKGERDDAAERARTTLAYARTRPEEDRVRDTYFLAAANFVLAQTLEMRAAAITIPEGGVPVQRPALERRAQLILAAQRAYFDTIRHTHPHWAAAAGYRIGAMYDAFWDAIRAAPVPDPSAAIGPGEIEIYEEEYRTYLARLIKPLIRHSIRYWELTLMMVERTGVTTEWTARIHEDLERARLRLLEQPSGPEGMDAAAARRRESAGLDTPSNPR